MSTEFTMSHLARGRYFTPAEANETLALIQDDVMLAKELLQEGRRVFAETTAVGGDGEAAVEDIQARIKVLLDRIHGHGVDLKGLEPALVDFPALRFGLDAFLCWKEGEDGVESWHPITTGIAGRELLAETPEEAWEWCN